MKTVKEMSQISGISVRTLHYYDQIGLLTPSFIVENGYRFYWGTTEAYQAFEKNPQTDFSVITEEMAAIMRDFAKLKEHSLSDSKVQKQVETLQSYISEHFYPCDMEILSGLGQVYIEDNRFTAFIDKAAGQGTASFVSSAIAEYVKNNG